mmetsp:Transcript_46801/g.111005  ORF Transcript_46801/g.111005 Transcript_46801/m.111005 type:complete len:269 (+) Transcript_46801:1183-1989(+)
MLGGSTLVSRLVRIVTCAESSPSTISEVASYAPSSHLQIRTPAALVSVVNSSPSLRSAPAAPLSSSGCPAVAGSNRGRRCKNGRSPASEPPVPLKNARPLASRRISSVFSRVSRVDAEPGWLYMSSMEYSRSGLVCLVLVEGLNCQSLTRRVFHSDSRTNATSSSHHVVPCSLHSVRRISTGLLSLSAMSSVYAISLCGTSTLGSPLSCASNQYRVEGLSALQTCPRPPLLRASRPMGIFSARGRRSIPRSSSPSAIRSTLTTSGKRL